MRKAIMSSVVVIGALLADPNSGGTQEATAKGGFVIIKDKNGLCIIEASKKVSDDQARLKVGKTNYPTHAEAEIDVRILCTNFDN